MSPRVQPAIARTAATALTPKAVTSNGMARVAGVASVRSGWKADLRHLTIMTADRFFEIQPRYDNSVLIFDFDKGI